MGDDAGNIRGVVLVELKTGSGQSCPLREESSGVGRGDLGEACHLIDGDDRKRLDPPHDFAFDVQRLSARGEDHQVGAMLREQVGKPGYGVEKVLAVVEYEEGRLRAESLDQSLVDAPAGYLGDAHGRGDSSGNGGRIDQRGQLDQPGPIVEIIKDVESDLHGQTRLPHAAWADHGDDAGGAKHLGQCRPLFRPPDEAGAQERQVVGEDPDGT
jgi:hypothetical protein